MPDNITTPAPATNQSAAPAIEVRDLSIGYGSRVVLENLNFRIEAGQIVTILGGSGCGKSTLLKHIIGLYKPLRGDILINPHAHVEIYYGDGLTVGAHDNYDGKKGDGSGREIRVDEIYAHFWTHVLRK